MVTGIQCQEMPCDGARKIQKKVIMGLYNRTGSNNESKEEINLSGYA